MNTAVLVPSNFLNPRQKFVSALQYPFFYSLLFDIFDHVDVPPHRLLSSEETHELLKERNLKLTQFPSIKMDDPVCRYLGGRPGDVFEITRNRPTVGQHLYYRKVVGGSSEQ